MESLLELFQQVKYYLNPTTIVAAGYVVLALVVFAETGLAVGIFLPGDSLLVVTGLFCARGDLNVLYILPMLWVCTVVGDTVGYFSGYKLGPRLFSKPKSLIFKPEHLHKAQHFYDKYGGKTILFARFVPIVRTFSPLVAGATQMPYRRFIAYDVIGGFLWVFSMVLGGYFLGNFIERTFGVKLDQHIEKVVIVVVALSLMPMVIEFLKSRRAKREAALATQD
jgi:membrane-associated protein